MAKEHVVKEGARVKKSTGDRIVDVIIYAALGLIALSTVLPFLYVVAGSFATEKELTEKAFFIIPTEFSLNAYQYAIRTANILRGLRNSIVLTILGTVMCMLFSGGMIPSYMVINAYGLYDTYWALVLPALINPFNMVIIKKFFTGLPVELDEASYMDGANDLQIFTRVALPLSKPVIASISLFYGVGFWNDYFNAMIYLQTAEKFPIQIQLRSIILLSSSFSDAVMDFYDASGAPPDKAVKMACTVIATVPILCIYPFVQKYFTKGVMVGAVKG